MTSDELADHIEDTIRGCRGQALGPGHRQYGQGDTQQFESMDPVDILQMVREEVWDLINYAIMTDVQLQKLQGALRAVRS